MFRAAIPGAIVVVVAEIPIFARTNQLPATSARNRSRRHGRSHLSPKGPMLAAVPVARHSGLSRRGEKCDGGGERLVVKRIVGTPPPHLRCQETLSADAGDHRRMADTS
jgi:hypothetical protein